MQVQVIKGSEIVWEHFCNVPTGIYKEFINTTHCKPEDINAYFQRWVRLDYHRRIKTAYSEGIEALKQMVIRDCRQAYPEMYIYKDYGLIPDESFWLSLWVSSHMKYEIEVRKLI